MGSIRAQAWVWGDEGEAAAVPAAARGELAGRAGHLCQGCRRRRALFSYRGFVKADRSHTLCFACYRSELQRAEARRLRGAATDPIIYEDLERRRRHAQLAARRALEGRPVVSDWGPARLAAG
jgi:hypothetical protein